jgi:glucose-6-phosphate isomerase
MIFRFVPKKIKIMDAKQTLIPHAEAISRTHLRELLSDEARNAAFTVSFENLLFDFSHSKLTTETLDLLSDPLQPVFAKISSMFQGEKINSTENRSVWHTLLRAEESDSPEFQEVLSVRAAIKDFARRIREGNLRGVSGKVFKNILCIGIGGSYLGPEFVAEALRTDPGALAHTGGRRLRFLANVDPVDFLRCTEGLDPSETLAIVISKTFTTAETMMNARKVKEWLISALSAHPAEEVVASHMCAVSTNLAKTAEFGINSERVFGFWDWVGGRFSVTSAVGLLPLYLEYGDVIDDFLAGARSVDNLFLEKANHDHWKQNIPLLMGVIGWWNTECLRYSSRAILPYSQALVRFAAHIQQLDMESNGKQAMITGEAIENTGPIVFGEPGTNGQHSFYQLMHQGRVVPAEFIGFCKSHSIDKEAHDELMCNFFAQPDALALGNTEQQLQNEGCPERLIPHKLFRGDRPSFSLLFESLNAYTVGQLLALYEHRVAVEGFLWNINSFDQFGVELGKSLATRVKGVLKSGDLSTQPSKRLLSHYISHRAN